MRQRTTPLVALCGLIGLGVATRAGDDVRHATVVPEATLRFIADEVNGFAAFNNLAVITTYHRTNGSDDLAALLVRMTAKWERYGFRNVQILRVPVRTGYEFFGLQNFDGQVPSRVRGAELRLVKPHPKLITTTESAPSALVGGSRAVDLTAPVVWIGRGDDPKNYEGKDLKGKIVLAGNALAEAVNQVAVHRYGAAGVLMFYDLPHNSGDNNDANLDTWMSPRGKEGSPSTFAFMLSNNQYRLLKGLLDRGEPVVVHAKVDVEIKQGDEAVFEMLDASIPGTTYPDEEFLIWAHMDHPLPGAVDNGSGMAVVMEIARTLRALVDNGVVPAPKRTIRFLWAPHVTGLYMYFSQHPERLGRIRGGLSIDSVGIDQAVFSSFFAVSKPSHALASYWTAALESLTEHLAQRTNRDLLDYSNLDNLYTPEGSRQQFNMRLQPYNGGGDEFQSNNNTVGIPTMAFGSAPVPPRHSQLNGLSYIDPTGLHRASYLGAALAFLFGWADADTVWRLTDEVYYRGLLHLTAEAEKARTALMVAARAEVPSAYARGRLLLKYGGERELRMLASLRPLVPAAPAALARIDERRRRIETFVASFQAELAGEFNRRCHELGLDAVEPAPTPEERALDELVPVPVPGIVGTSSYFGGYYEKVIGRERLASFQLNPNFAYGVMGYTEAHNFIDGKRSILDIYQATAAELWSEGYPHSHDITLTEAGRYMRMLEAAKVITLRKKRLEKP